MNKKLFVLAICLLSAAGCGRYEGHNGYHHAWRDFEELHIVSADRNNDGETTLDEMSRFKRVWLAKQGWTARKGFNQVYDLNGGRISAARFAEAFR